MKSGRWPSPKAQNPLNALTVGSGLMPDPKFNKFNKLNKFNGQAQRPKPSLGPGLRPGPTLNEFDYFNKFNKFNRWLGLALDQARNLIP